MIDIQSGALKGRTGILAPTSEVSINFGSESHRATGRLSQLSGNSVGFSAQCELAAGDVLNRTLICKDQYDIGCLGTDLPADAATRQGDEGGVAGNRARVRGQQG